MQLNRNFEFRHALSRFGRGDNRVRGSSIYQLLTPTTRLPNLSQRATQFTVRIKDKYGSPLKKYSNQGYDLCDI